jgi:hypothetical protein
MINRNQLIDGLKDFLRDSALMGYRTYRRENRYATLKLAGAAIGGVAIGVAVGMLIAPKPGDKLRADLSKKASQLADKATEMGKEQLGQLVEKVSPNGHRGHHA